ncbi:hypothetical protein L2E82_48377 [Cichorium intybus]|uniref:Uncharacterized protein n=1 Tax=Cichorium intybus TaxID=13427 RepID=A0ACB8YXW9_CICIN|nr:hypothetical protein L2E82_48377 [Cichorium intybus]
MHQGLLVTTGNHPIPPLPIVISPENHPQQQQTLLPDFSITVDLSPAVQIFLSHVRSRTHISPAHRRRRSPPSSSAAAIAAAIVIIQSLCDSFSQNLFPSF